MCACTLCMAYVCGVPVHYYNNVLVITFGSKANTRTHLHNSHFYTRTHLYTSMYGATMQTHSRMHANTCTYLQPHTHTYMCMHIYTHTCIPRCAMFRRKLQALGYHSATTFNLKAPTDLQTLVAWLEDQKIRHLKIDEREALRKTDQESIWSDAFAKYLATLECPYEFSEQAEAALDWLLGIAVRYHYMDEAEREPGLRRDLASSMAGDGNPAPAVLRQSGESTSMNFDPSEATFAADIQSLGELVKVAPHPDPAVFLEAIRLVIQEKLSTEALEAARERAAAVDKKKPPKCYDVSPRECGFDIADPALAEAAKVLRLLHLRELRRLQTHVNEMIVAVQAMTANPKTDQSLGQVGR